MRRLAQLISWGALLAILLLAALFFADQLTLPAMQRWLLGVAVLWFISTPVWMGRRRNG